MDALRRVSAFLFYVLGVLTIVLIVLAQRGDYSARIAPVLPLLDLPLLFLGVLYGGSSLYVSLTRGNRSIALLLTIFLPLVLVLCFFLYVNFALPFAEV